MNRTTTAGCVVVVLLGTKFGRAWFILSCLACLALPAQAATKTWDANGLSPPIGVFNVGNNWNVNPAPTNLDSAVFNLAPTYTVIFNNSPTNNDLTVSAGNVTFTSSGGARTYSLTDASGGRDATITGGALTLGAVGNPLHLTIGDDLRIRGGGLMLASFHSDISTVDMVLGDSTAPAGSGTLIVDGVGSSLAVSASAQLGAGGHTGVLVVRNGATADFNGILGLADASTSHFSNGILSVESGGTLTTANIRIGSNATNGQTGAFHVGSAVSTSTVTQDANATLVVGATLGGPTPNSGTLNINSGGVFNSGGGTGTITINPTGTVNVASGGALHAKGNVSIDDGALTRASGGTFSLAINRTMTIKNAGRFDVTGDFATDHETYIVTGASSAWTNSGTLNIGQIGHLVGTSTLKIEDGGRVFNTLGIVDGPILSASNVTVTGARSKWTNSNALLIGYEGDGSLTISATGEVASDSAYLGILAGSNGAVKVTGPGSTWDTTSGLGLTLGLLIVGEQGVGKLEIEDGGAVTSTLGIVGYTPGSDGDVTVTGAGSTWTNSSLYIGSEGAGTLEIADGGEVLSNGIPGTNVGVGGYIGYAAGNDGDVTVTDLGSKWTLTNFLYVGGNDIGELGGKGKLTISEGGEVSCTIGSIGRSSGSNGEVTVTGAGSNWTNSLDLTVGDSSIGKLTISAHGAVSNRDGIVGYAAGSEGAVTVTGAFSTWTNSQNLTVGDNGNGKLRIENEGEVVNSVGYVGLSANSNGEVTVTGAGSIWTNSLDLTVGDSGIGKLRIENGGKVVNSRAGFVGANVNGKGEVTVTGPGSIWTNGQFLRVGGGLATAGGAGTVVISDDGIVAASVNGGNTVVRDDGSIHVQAGGAFNANGKVTINGGLLKVDTGGSVTVAASTTITLSNAGTLQGSGSVIGAVVNMSGVVSPGTSTGTLSIESVPGEIDGNYTQDAAGQLLIELAAASYDTLDVANSVSLAGTLDVNLLGGYSPAAGSSFDILNFGTLTGTFTTLNLPALTAGLMWDTSLLYTDGVLSVASPFLEADFNENGTVNAADLALWKTGFGMSANATHLQGDANGDLDVDGADFLAWQRQFGNPALVVSVNAPVPEPATFFIFIMATAGIRPMRGQMRHKLVSA